MNGKWKWEAHAASHSDKTRNDCCCCFLCNGIMTASDKMPDNFFFYPTHHVRTASATTAAMVGVVSREDGQLNGRSQRVEPPTDAATTQAASSYNRPTSAPVTR